MDEQFNGNEQCEDFEIFAQDRTSSPEDIYFDQVVSALQEIMLEEQFDTIQDSFMRKHCAIFDQNEVNKNEYMQIFILYQKEIESFVEQNLKQKVNNFDMPKFAALLEQRTNQIDEQILEMIESFTDFQTFKRIMLEYKGYYQNEQQFKGLVLKSNRIN